MSILGSINELLVVMKARDEASDVVEDMEKSVEKSLGEKGIVKHAKVGALAVAGVATAAAGVVAGLKALVDSVTATGDEFQKMSLRTGVSVEELSTLSFAAERSGASVEVLEDGLKDLSIRAFEATAETGEAAEGFKALGVNVTDANGKLKPTEDLLRELSDKFRLLKDDTRAAALAELTFGEAGVQLLPLLKQGSTEIKALQERARDLGLEFSNNSANASVAYKEAVTDLSAVLTGLKTQVGMELVPAFTAATLRITEFVQEMKEEGSALHQTWEAIGKGVETFESIDKTLTQTSEDVTAFGESIDILGYSSFMDTAAEKALALVGVTVDLTNKTKAFAGSDGGAVEKAKFSLEALAADRGPIAETEVKFKNMDTAIGNANAQLGYMKDDVVALPSILEQPVDDVEAEFRQLDTEIGKPKASVGSLKTGMQNLSEGIETPFGAVSGKFGEVKGSVDTASTALGGFVNDLNEIPEPDPVPIDVELTPEEEIAERARERFHAGLKSGFDMLLHGETDFKGLLKGWGGDILDGITGGISENLATKFTNVLFANGEGVLGTVWSSFGTNSAGSFLGGFTENLSGDISSELSGALGDVTAATAAGGAGAGGTVATGGVAGAAASLGTAASAVAVAAFAAGFIKTGIEVFSGKETTVNEEIARLGGPSNLQNLSMTELKRLEGMARRQGQDEQLRLILDAQRVVSAWDDIRNTPAESTPVDPGAAAAAHDANAAQWASYVVSQAQNRFSSAVQPGGRLQGLTFEEMQTAAALMGENGTATAKDILLSNGIDVNNAIEKFIQHVANTARISTFQIGGIVPGPPGQPRMVMAEGGEEFIPRGRGFVGGGRTGNIINLYFNVSLHSPDVDSTRALINGEFGDMILERIRRESERNYPVLYNTGVSNPPLT